MNNAIVAYIRTGVPILVGYLLTLLAQSTGVIIDDGSKASLVTGLTALVIAVYYILFHLLEQYVPQLGWFLGYAKSPAYVGVAGDKPAVITDVPSSDPSAVVADTGQVDQPGIAAAADAGFRPHQINVD